MRRNVLGLSKLALIVSIGCPALLAQSQTTGAFAGTVRDPAGNPIAGATVRASSAQIQKVTTTDAEGNYRMTLLNPGTWNVDVSKAGLQTIATKLTINTATTAAIHFRMRPVETAVVEVVATATTVAVDTTSTSIGQTVNAELIQRLPTGRNFSDISYLTPGTIDSGWGDPSVGGGSAAENQYLVDGLVTTDFRSGFQGARMPREFVEQVEVQTGGYAPEYSALGGVVIAVTKQGTNTFQGSSFYSQNLPNMQGIGKYNPEVDQRRPGLPQQSREVGATVGGPIVKDRLFYFFGGDFSRTDADNSKNTPNFEGLVNNNMAPTYLNLFGKLNGYFTPNLQLSLVGQIIRDRSGSTHAYLASGTSEQGVTNKRDDSTFNLVFDWTINSNLLLSVKFGRATFSSSQTPARNELLVQDQVYYQLGPGKNSVPAGLHPDSTFFTYGGIGGFEAKNEGITDQCMIDLSWFTGHHSLKTGLSFLRPRFALVEAVPTYGYRFVRIYAFNQPGPNQGQFRGIMRDHYSQNANVHSNNTAFYAQDLWEIVPGFRLKYGLRYEAQEVFNSSGQSWIKFSKPSEVTQPRIGFVWDPWKDGKAKLTGSYARYYEMIPLQPVQREGGTERFWREYYSGSQASYDYATGAWTVSDPPNGIPGIWGQGIRDFGYFFNTPSLQEGLKPASRDEGTLGAEYLTNSGWKFGLNFRWRKLGNTIEDSVFTDADGNPVDDGEGFAVLWNPHPGKVRFQGNPNSSNPGKWYEIDNTLFPTAYNDYKALEFTAMKQTARWFFSASYTLSRLSGTYEGLVSSSNGQADANITEAFDYYPYVGLGVLPLDRTHVIKLIGTYLVPLGNNQLSLGVVWNGKSGMKATFFDNSNDIGGYDGSTKVDGRYGGGPRLPFASKLDLNLKYTFRFDNRLSLSPTFEIFNVFNEMPTTRIYTTKANSSHDYPDGHPYFLKPTAWQGPRYCQLSLSLTW